MSNLFTLMHSKPKAGDPPGPIVSWIQLGEYAKDENGNVLITPKCFSLRDIEQQIDRRIGELQDIKKKTKNLYK